MISAMVAHLYRFLTHVFHADASYIVLLFEVQSCLLGEKLRSKLLLGVLISISM